MAEKVKVTARKTFALGGRFRSGETEVPADKVATLVKKGLIEPPAGFGEAPAGGTGKVVATAAVGDTPSPSTESADAQESEPAKQASRKGRKGK